MQKTKDEVVATRNHKRYIIVKSYDYWGNWEYKLFDVIENCLLLKDICFKKLNDLMYSL